MRCAIAQGLEGSRFGAYPATLATLVSARVRPRHVKSGGSRELPSAMQLYDPGVNESKATREWIASTRFREPPVITRFDGISAKTKCCEGGGTRAKAAPLQAAGQSHIT